MPVYALNLFDVANRDEYLAYARRSVAEVQAHGGRDSIPIFTSEAEAKAQVAGSGHEAEVVGVRPGLLAAILQGTEYAILNPGGPAPLQFKTSAVANYIDGA